MAVTYFQAFVPAQAHGTCRPDRRLVQQPRKNYSHSLAVTALPARSLRRSRAGKLHTCDAHSSGNGSTASVEQREPSAEPQKLFPEHAQYRRVLLKISGEALQGGMGFGVDPQVLKFVAREVAAVMTKGVQVAIVVGGGNYFRGANAWDGLERSTADYIGMLATCMNALSLQASLESVGVPTRVQTAIEMREVAEPYIQRRAVRHLDKGRVVIFGGGIGNPFFTTDTAAALRAAEIGADAFFKATKVDGVYDSDPNKHPNAKLHKRLSYKQVTTQDLDVMDQTAITLCKENAIPVIVFNLTKAGNIIKALTGHPVGTTVDEDGSDEDSQPDTADKHFMYDAASM